MKIQVTRSTSETIRNIHLGIKNSTFHPFCNGTNSYSFFRLQQLIKKLKKLTEQNWQKIYYKLCNCGEMQTQ